MDKGHFDSLIRALGQSRSRRSAMFAAVAAAFGGANLALEHAAAGKRSRRKKRRRRQRRRRNGSGPGGTLGTETCANTNGCDGIQCQPGNAICTCRILSGSGGVVCAGTLNDVLNCGQCGPNELCVDLSACGGAGAVGCALPCS